MFCLKIYSYILVHRKHFTFDRMLLIGYRKKPLYSVFVCLGGYKQLTFTKKCFLYCKTLIKYVSNKENFSNTDINIVTSFYFMRSTLYCM